MFPILNLAFIVRPPRNGENVAPPPPASSSSSSRRKEKNFSGKERHEEGEEIGNELGRKVPLPPRAKAVPAARARVHHQVRAKEGQAQAREAQVQAMATTRTWVHQVPAMTIEICCEVLVWMYKKYMGVMSGDCAVAIMTCSRQTQSKFIVVRKCINFLLLTFDFFYVLSDLIRSSMRVRRSGDENASLFVPFSTKLQN